MKLKDFEELTNLEYSQLQAFRKLKEYTRLKNNEFSFDKGYNKYDILWNIYNQQKDIYLSKKDYVMASVVYNRMYELLRKEKEYDKALDFLICCLYLRVYDNCFYERHLVKFMKELKTLLKRNKINIEEFEIRCKFITEYIKIPIQTYLPHWYEFEKVNMFQRKINEFLDA